MQIEDRSRGALLENLRLDIGLGLFEGQVPYKGSLSFNIHQLVGGLRAGMGYVGCRDVATLRARARFMQITAAGLREGHVHDVFITK
ncbi:MAG: IMP dehydrogenase, partial [Methyloceanibacter sp.]